MTHSFADPSLATCAPTIIKFDELTVQARRRSRSKDNDPIDPI
jgi:hypothetical protein